MTCGQQAREAEEEDTKKKRKFLREARAERELEESGPKSKFDHQDPKVHRVTSDGLPVYKYYHLGMKQDDGGTPLCPFDCNCCF